MKSRHQYQWRDFLHSLISADTVEAMLKSETSKNNVEIKAYTLPVLAVPLLFIAGAWGAGHYPVVGRGEGILPTTFVPPSLLVGCVIFSVFYGGFCLWLAKLHQKPADFLATFFVAVFAGAAIFIGFCALTFSTLALSLNGLLDASQPLAHQTTIQKCDLFVGKASQGRNCMYYIVQANDWKSSKSRVRLNVSQKLPHVAVGSQLMVVTRRGFLGYEWIVNIQPTPDIP